jgi:hypothetical protein
MAEDEEGKAGIGGEAPADPAANVEEAERPKNGPKSGVTRRSKDPSEKKTPKIKTATKPKEGSKKPTYTRPYPLYSLQKSLALATAIKEKNAGNPWASSQVPMLVRHGVA